MFYVAEKDREWGSLQVQALAKVLLLGMMAVRNTDADVNVIGLIGERGREVREFLEKNLGEGRVG